MLYPVADLLVTDEDYIQVLETEPAERQNLPSYCREKYI